MQDTTKPNVDAIVETPTTGNNDEEVHTPKSFRKKYHCGNTKMYEEIDAGRLKAKKNGSSTLIINARTWFQNLPDYEPST